MVISVTIPMATLFYVDILEVYPAGTLEEPTFVEAGYEINRPAIVVNIKLDNFPILTIKGPAGDPYSLEREMSLLAEFVDFCIYKTQEKWIVPDQPSGHKYSFHFEIEGTEVHVSYLEIAEGSGYFTINGHRVDEETILVVQNPELEIVFTDTSSQEDAIERVKVKITKDGTPTELWPAQNGRIWSVDYTLPEFGKYAIEGWFWTEAGGTKVMSVLALWGDGTGDGVDGDGQEPKWKMNKVTWVGLGLFIVGVVTTFMRGKKR